MKKLRCIERGLRAIVPIVVLVLFALPAAAVPPDGIRVGAQVLGQNLLGVSAEWVFSQNGIGLEAGIFDALNEPVLTLFYRRYLVFAGMANAGFAPSIGAEMIATTNLSSLGSPQPSVLGALGATVGLDWTFLTRFSLALELHGFHGMDLVSGAAGEFGFSPSLSARIGF
jgi:hypothetical protein